MKKRIIIYILLLVMVGAYIIYPHIEPVVNISDPVFNTSLKIENNSIKNNFSEINYLENIPVVYIKGGGYQAGLIHGKLLKKQIQEIVQILNEDILHKNTVKGFFVDTYLLRKAKQLDKFIPQTYREEIKGIAKGAEVSYNDILLINTYDDLLYLSGCSSIAATKNDKNQIFFHARNLDYQIDILSGKNVIFHYLDKDFISVGFPGYIGALSATNYKGISLSSHTAFVSENEKGVPTGILYRKIIEEAENLTDVESILNNNKRTIGNNLLVSSLNENKVVNFEITASDVVKISNQNYAIATNHFVSDKLSKINNPIIDSTKRYDYLKNFYKNLSDTNVDKIKQTMSFYDKNPKGWSSIANKGTVQSVIFLPEQKIIYVAKGTETPVNKDGYVEYDYSQVIYK